MDNNTPICGKAAVSEVREELNFIYKERDSLQKNIAVLKEKLQTVLANRPKDAQPISEKIELCVLGSELRELGEAFTNANDDIRNIIGCIEL